MHLLDVSPETALVAKDFTANFTFARAAAGKGYLDVALHYRQYSMTLRKKLNMLFNSTLLRSIKYLQYGKIVNFLNCIY